MSINMTEAEITRATTLLEDEGSAKIEKIQIGRWAIASDRGLYGVFDTKSDAIDTALSSHCQMRDACKVKRHRKGIYTLAILDCDEDPAERFYHEFTLERITTDNILRFKELVLTEYLPSWYFDPYSDEYKEYHGG